MDDGIGGGLFPPAFDDEFPVGAQDGNRAYFGRRVLRGLVDGIEDYVAARQDRWKGFRSVGPGLLGSAMWMDDPEMLDALGTLSHVCVVVRKERREHPTMPALREIADRVPGIPARAFPELSQLALKEDGKPLILSPDRRIEDEPVIPSVRSIGFRAAQRSMVPIVHAKLALLGHFWWHDEGADGQLEDVLGFRAQRLWISSANFTRASRRSLDFGYWTEDPALMEGARRFLLHLIEASEPIDSAADALDPELAMVEYDDEAWAEYAAEMSGPTVGEDRP